MRMRKLCVILAASCVLPRGGAAEPAAADGLVGWWRFEQAHGTLLPDSSALANDAFAIYVKLAKGVEGRGALFDAQMASVTVRTSPSLAVFEGLTLEAWVKLGDSRLPGFPSVMRKDHSYALRFGERRLGFLLWSGGKVVGLSAQKTDWEAGRWHHLAGTWDGQTMRIYIDGRPAGRHDFSGPVDVMPTALHMGGFGGRYCLTGVIDEARVYNRGLGPEEIRRSYARGLAALAAEKDRKVAIVTVGKSRQAASAALRKPARPIRMVRKGFVWIDTEDFQDYGGWLLDTQFVYLMGSAYLIAAGIGKPVADARVAFTLPEAGRWRVWVRSKDWLPAYSPGRFTVAVNGVTSSRVFGKRADDGWAWESAGEFDLPAGRVTIALKDRTGYYARCDALVLTTDMGYTPPADMAGVNRERARLTGLSLEPRDGGEWDVIVVGAGPAGSPAALAAARSGARTALIQNRPVLGGNASIELGVPMNGAAGLHPDARETGIAEEAGAIRCRYGYLKMSGPFRLLAEREPNLTVFLNEHVFDVIMADDSTIAAVKAVNTLTNAITVYRAKRFIDCTGDGWVGYFAKAEYRLGRESRDEFHESLAPEKADKITMSGCLMGGALNYRADNMGRPVAYTPPPWAAKLPPPEKFHRYPRSFRGGQWWMEHRGTIDDLWEAEKARDELIRIVYAYWGWIKNASPFKEAARDYALARIPIVEAKRESRRLVGDVILTQNDVQAARLFPDRISYGGWPLDVHNANGIFSGEEGPFHCDVQVPIYSIPFRTLYSKNIDNLLMAGRCMSVTHIALGTVRVENTLATLGQAAGTAAAMSIRLGVTPRGLYRGHIVALQQQLLKDDLTIPGIPNRDPKDLARQAAVTATSVKRFEEADGHFFRAGEIHPLNMRRAVHFPVGLRRRIFAVSLRLKNTTDKAIEVTAHLRPAARPDDFSAREDLARAANSVPPKSEAWVEFTFDVRPDCPQAWIWLPRAEGISWRLMDNGPPGACRAYAAADGAADGAAWTVVPGQYYAFRVTPPIRLAVKGFGPEGAIDGWTRKLDGVPHMWAGDPAQKLPQSIELSWDKARKIDSVYLTFDTNLNIKRMAAPAPPECVRDYDVEVYDGKAWRRVVEARGNFQRRQIHRFPPCTVRKLRVTVRATNGVREPRIYEIRVYNE